MDTITLGAHAINITHPERVLFPADGITKGDLADYYARIAPTMFPHVESRLITMQRFPNGIGGEGFIQKEAPAYYPAWIERKTVAKEGGKMHEVVCNDPAVPVYLANQSCITPHVWLSRADRLHFPDRMIFDLDPPDGRFEFARFAAQEARALLKELGLTAFVMTTGSHGLHVTVPLIAEADFETVRGFAQDAAALLAQRHPDRLTTEPRKEARQGRLYLDSLRNAYAQTAVPPYAVRARPRAPVATPLDWSELDDPDLRSDRTTLRTLWERLAAHPDPWASIDKHAQSLREPRRRLDTLLHSRNA